MHPRSGASGVGDAVNNRFVTVVMDTSAVLFLSSRDSTDDVDELLLLLLSLPWR